MKVCVCYLVCKFFFIIFHYCSGGIDLLICAVLFSLTLWGETRNSSITWFRRYFYFSQCNGCCVLTALRWIFIALPHQNSYCAIYKNFIPRPYCDNFLRYMFIYCIINDSIKCINLEYISSISREFKTSSSPLILASSISHMFKSALL